MSEPRRRRRRTDNDVQLPDQGASTTFTPMPVTQSRIRETKLVVQTEQVNLAKISQLEKPIGEIRNVNSKPVERIVDAKAAYIAAFGLQFGSIVSYKKRYWRSRGG